MLLAAAPQPFLTPSSASAIAEWRCHALLYGYRGCARPNDTFYIEIRGGNDSIVTEKEKRRLYHAEEDEHLRAEWAARLSEDVDAEVAFYAQRNGERKACRRARRADKARRGAFIEAQLAGRRRSTKMTTADDRRYRWSPPRRMKSDFDM